jgi:PPP family 3-phenylpropionic acid transporter
MLYSFSAVYLTHKGFTDTQIGYTVSLIGFLNIILQLAVSSFSDSHSTIPLKRIIAALYIISIAFGVLMSSLPLATALLMFVFMTASSTQNSVSTLLNSMTLQYNNNGINATYGWPRGIGSIAYAVLAFFGGQIVKRYSPAILPYLFILFAVIALAAILMMPDPFKLIGENTAGNTQGSKKKNSSTSFKDMMLKNPILLIFALAVLVNSAGQVAVNTFLIRIVESLGGDTRTLGTCMFLQAVVEFPIMAVSSFLMTKFKARYLLLISFFCFAVKMFALANAPSLAVVYGAMVFSIFCFGLYAVTMLVFVNRIVGITEKVRGQAVVSVFGSFGAMIGNAVSGRMIDTVGLKFQLNISWIACLLAAFLMLACCLIFNRKFGKDA